MDEVTEVKGNTLLKWIAVNAIGFGLAFVAILQVGMFFEFGFDWKMHWHWVEKPLDNDVAEYLSLLGAFLVGGAVLGSAQVLGLPAGSSRPIPWILATVAGFGFAAVCIDWPLIAIGVLGVIPGPVEPLIITVGGGTFAGIAQFVTLTRGGFSAGRWLVLWIFGLVVGVVPMAVLMTSLESFALGFSWPVEVFITGFVIAGVAAWVSGRALATASRTP